MLFELSEERAESGGGGVFREKSTWCVIGSPDTAGRVWRRA